jgi:SPW repeat
MSQNPPMAEHPELADVKRAHDRRELRERYERASETPSGQLVEGLIVLSGLYIALSTWIVGVTGPLQINNLVIGLAVAALGIGFAVDYGSTHRLAWVCPVLGVWTIVALWAVTGATRTASSMLSNIIAGAVVLLCGLAILGIGTGRVAGTTSLGRR